MTLSPEQRYNELLSRLEAIEKKLDKLVPSKVTLRRVVPSEPVREIVRPVKPEELPEKGYVKGLIKARRLG